MLDTDAAWIIREPHEQEEGKNKYEPFIVERDQLIRYGHRWFQNSPDFVDSIRVAPHVVHLFGPLNDKAIKRNSYFSLNCK